MATKLNEIFETFAETFEDLSKTITKDSSSYEFEASFNGVIRDFRQTVYQSMIGKYTKIKKRSYHHSYNCGRYLFP